MVGFLWKKTRLGMQLRLSLKLPQRLPRRLQLRLPLRLQPQRECIRWPGVLVFVMLIAAAAPVQLHAEGDVSLEYTLQNTILRTRALVYETDGTFKEAGDQYWGYAVSGTAGLSYESTDTRNIKGDLTFDFNLPEVEATTGAEVPTITLKRAYVKARFPSFRLTAGKTRLGWGDGFVFNSGDVIFGSTSPYVDLTAAEVRTETKWLTAVNIPLGRFSFIEALVVPPPSDLLGGRIAGDITATSGGGRLYTMIGNTKLETGYMFRGDGDEPLHRPYIGLQGNFGPDWYLAGSVALPAVNGDIESTVEESFNVSFGLFHLQQLNRVQSLSMRLEGLVLPLQEWEETTAQTPEEMPTYGILLYPELTYIPGDTLQVSLRSVISPVDLSVQMTAGVSWNVLQGFTLNGYATVNLGGPSDTFAWDRDTDLWRPEADYINGIAVTAGFEYIY